MITSKNLCPEDGGGVNIRSNIISTFEGIRQIVDLHVQSFCLPYYFPLCVDNFTNTYLLNN